MICDGLTASLSQPLIISWTSSYLQSTRETMLSDGGRNVQRSDSQTEWLNGPYYDHPRAEREQGFDYESMRYEKPLVHLQPIVQCEDTSAV